MRDPGGLLLSRPDSPGMGKKMVSSITGCELNLWPRGGAYIGDSTWVEVKTNPLAGCGTSTAC